MTTLTNQYFKDTTEIFEDFNDQVAREAKKQHSDFLNDCQREDFKISEAVEQWVLDNGEPDIAFQELMTTEDDENLLMVLELSLIHI